MLEVNDREIRDLIDREAVLLGISGNEAIERVRQGQTGSNYIWRDLESLVELLAA